MNATTNTSKLRNHIKNMHEGVIYPCHQWDYFATDTSSLMKHVKIKHKV